jgi:hypothetical protein
VRFPTKPSPTPVAAALALIVLAALVATASADAPSDQQITAARTQLTITISRGRGGKAANGPSTNPAMSNDKRYVRAVAYESEASNLGPRDNNRVKDVYVVLRGNRANNVGTIWKPGRNLLMSRTRGGAAGNGPSYSPAIDGSFRTRPTCVGFLSAASDLVPGDTNGQPDAFIKKIRSGVVRRLRPAGAQPKQPATAVAVSGNCKLIAFVQGGKLYVSKGGRKARRVRTRGAAADPSFSTGLRNDLVFGARGGVYLLKNARGRARLVGRGGRNPVYNDIKNTVVAYEKRRGGHWQIAMRGLGRVDSRIGKREKFVSKYRGRLGNGDSRSPVIGNSGFYVTFESDASNLQTSAAGSAQDNNGVTDTYLYTDVRDITLIQSVNDAGDVIPGGGKRPAMSFYANYIAFDSPGPIGSTGNNLQVFLRWLGAV